MAEWLAVQGRTLKYGAFVVSRRVEIYWPLLQKHYAGQITHFYADKGSHCVRYEVRLKPWLTVTSSPDSTSLCIIAVLTGVAWRRIFNAYLPVASLA